MFSLDQGLVTVTHTPDQPMKSCFESLLQIEIHNDRASWPPKLSLPMNYKAKKGRFTSTW